MDDIRSTKSIDNAEGRVKWFDPKKGFGFIMGPEEQDVFTHYTRIEGDGFRALEDGALVRYSAVLTERGWHATTVLRLERENGTPTRRYARTIRR
jgi:cold shock protein